MSRWLFASRPTVRRPISHVAWHGPRPYDWARDPDMNDESVLDTWLREQAAIRDAQADADTDGRFDDELWSA